MRTQTRLIGWGFVFFAFFVGLNGLAQRLGAQETLKGTKPLVLVVHGVGTDFSGPNPREGGWSSDVANAYGVPVKEITFRYPGRTRVMSFVDFGRQAHPWAIQAQQQIQAAVKDNPGRRVIIISHSWGTVAAKMALEGEFGSGDLEAIKGVKVDEWVTLGSPLGMTRDHWWSLKTTRVSVEPGKPAAVKNWTNFYDPDDPISAESHDLPGADNVALTGSGKGGLLDGLFAHWGVWTHPEVIKWMKARYNFHTYRPIEEIEAEFEKEHPRKPTKPTTGGSTPVIPVKPVATQLDYQPICNSAMTAIERDHEETTLKVSGPTYQASVDWVPELKYDKGDCVGAYRKWITYPDGKKYKTLDWATDTGAGRLEASGLIRLYANVYPGLQWTATPRR